MSGGRNVCVSERERESCGCGDVSKSVMDV